MKGRRRRLTVKARNVLFLVAIVAALTPLSHHSYFATQAQTGPAESLAAPALSASSTGANAAALRWNAVSGAARYKLWAWWKGVTTAGSNWTAATTEREALTALYEATNGANWSRSDNWLTELPISTWYGVYTDASGRVTGLDLSSNGLHGPLPDLSAFTNLMSLSLHSNQLTGSIPDLSALTSLEWLSLSHNHLTGPIPDLSALTRLNSLDLGANKLSGPVPDLSALTDLMSLSLHSNQLTGSIPDLSALTGLAWLSLSHNWLTGPIPDLSALTKLTVLEIGYNRLTGPIPDLHALTELTRLDLAYNQLCLPERLSFPGSNVVVTAHLKSLDLPSCSFAAPEERAALVALFETTDGANWKRNDNWLTESPIFTWYGVSTDASGRVIALDLSGNGLHGSFTDLSALINLEWLSLSYNRLSGPVPDLNALTKLTTLDLAGNQLCLPEKLSFPGSNAVVTDHLKSLDLPTCSFVAPEERAALVALYSTTDGANWKRNDNWLTELPVTTWYGVSTDASGRVTELLLARNGLRGPFPDLSALTSLTKLYLASNQLTGRIPAMDALTSLEWLSLSQNQLTGPIPDLSFLTNLTMLNLSHNRLTGPIPDLTSLTSLEKLSLSHNELTGRIPDLSFLTRLIRLDLRNNELTGPVVDLRLLTKLEALYLSDNQLTGPAPDLSSFTNLTVMRLTDNQLCLSPGFAPSGPNAEGAFHLKKLNLAPCTDAELSATPAAPSNLTPNSDAGQITLTWDRVENAATYELRAWDSLQRQWGLIDGVLTGTSFTHSVLTDGRNYYYQVRSRDADGGRSAWSGRVYAAVVPPLFPPPPESLGLDMFYQKYFDAGGVVVVAPSEVSDKKMVQAQEIITGLLSHLPGLLETLVANRARVAIFAYKEGLGGVIQLPEFRHLLEDASGMALRSPTGWVAAVPEDDYYCGLFVHEFAHLVHFAIEVQLNSGEYNSRLIDAYNAAMNAGLWQDEYASTNTAEYFAEAVKFWLWGSLPEWVVSNSSKLEDYDPEAAKLVKEVFGEATVPWYCKP